MNGELPKADSLEDKVFSVINEESFYSIALQVYHFQYHNNPVYQAWCDLLHRPPARVRETSDIPYLPIRFFKTHTITSGSFDPELVFKSSGTTGSVSSIHRVKKAGFYEKSFLSAFELFYGPVGDYCILGLLPSYLERGNSSLVYMVDRLIQWSGHPLNGFYLSDYERLRQTLTKLQRKAQRTMLIGVTYALLDFVQLYDMNLSNTIIMETGGMKGRKRELTKPELYAELKSGFGVTAIHSEYGMTELLSQAYAVDGVFRTPPWMRIVLRDETDPFLVQAQSGGGTGAINIMDLANLYSCSFIATDDVGKMHPDGRFEVLGRLDNSDIRGCSLLTT